MTTPSELEDYARVCDVIAYVGENWRRQPSLDELAGRMELTPDQLSRLFMRWAGLTPKAFLQAMTRDHAKRMLAQSARILDTALATGLSGPGRMHDLFVTHEGMSPGAYKKIGEGLVISYGYHPSPFGVALLMATANGLCGLAFADAGDEPLALHDMKARWPKAQHTEDPLATAPYAAKVFRREGLRLDERLHVTFIGTDFEIRVWETLLRIPVGKVATYGAIAASIGAPRAARAVGAAVGRNPLSFVVPCHRVIGSSGALTGYHWGLTRKKAILGWEAGKQAS